MTAVWALLLYDEGTAWPMFVLFGLVSAISIPFFVHLVRGVAGLSYTFDPRTQIIERNRHPFASFPDVKAIEMEKVVLETHDQYRLRLLLTKGTQVELGRISGRDEAEKVAAAVADVLAVPIRDK